MTIDDDGLDSAVDISHDDRTARRIVLGIVVFLLMLASVQLGIARGRAVADCRAAVLILEEGGGGGAGGGEGGGSRSAN